MSNSRRSKIYGKAFPISEQEAKSYSRTERPRSFKANPIGVTHMNSVNGRGAYKKSARQAAAGKTPTERLSRARTVMRNGSSMAGILKNKKSGSGKRKVPGTSYYQTPNGRFQNAKGKFVKSATVSRVKKNAASKKRSLKANASVGASKSYSQGWDAMERAKKRKAAAAKRKRTAAKSSSSTTTTRKRKTAAKRKPAVKKYKRLTLKDPRTGKARKSYMYKTVGGKRRRIPMTALKIPAKTIRKRRATAAAKIKKSGSTFVANGVSVKRRRAGKRLAAYNAAIRRGLTKSGAAQAAIKAVPLKTIGESFKGITKIGRLPRTVNVAKKGRKRLVANRKKRKTAAVLVANPPKKRRKRRKASTKRRRAATTKRRAPAKRRRTAAKRRKSPVTKRRAPVKRRRTAAKRRAPAKRRKTAAKRRAPKRRRKSMRRNARRSYKRNPAWLQNFKNALVTGLFITGGFVFHKVATNLATDPIFDLFKEKEAPAAAAGTDFDIEPWKKPIVGAGILAIGIPLANMAFKKRAMEIGGGMVASWLHSVIVAVSVVSKNEKFASAVAGVPDRFDWSGRKWPYRNSRAASLGGRRRGVRGLSGNSQDLSSIMPRYTPITRGGMGATQAAAGQYQQAAAGQYQQAAAGSMGEYFTPMNAMGEYFAPSSLQGVGAYEPAGTLAMPKVNQVIRDGIRPDSDLDRQMSIMEAAAGMGDGLGSYFEAGPNGQVDTVGSESQWVPNGEM